MAKFCPYCGRPLSDGQKCSCAQSASAQTPEFNINIDKAAVKSFFEKMKNRMGLGDPESNKTDAYEKKKKIVPECIRANEGEIPVKQYEIAKLRNRLIGIPYSTARGRMQVTNKRVIFRAPGRCIAGRTTLQHEFAIDEIAGIEARREFSFSFWDLLFGSWGVALGGAVMTWFLLTITNQNPVALTFLGFLFGAALICPFFLVKKLWFLKLIGLGGACMSFFTTSMALRGFLNGLYIFFGILATIITIFCMVVFAIKPNLVLSIKTKSASDGISIKRKKAPFFLFFGGNVEENTGFTEVLPLDDAEKCIREINAMVTDIQKLGDFGIEKWKA